MGAVEAAGRDRCLLRGLRPDRRGLRRRLRLDHRCAARRGGDRARRAVSGHQRRCSQLPAQLDAHGTRTARHSVYRARWRYDDVWASHRARRGFSRGERAGRRRRLLRRKVAEPGLPVRVRRLRHGVRRCGQCGQRREPEDSARVALSLVVVDRSFVAANARELARMRAVVSRLRDRQLGAMVNEYWSVAGVLGHIAFWDGRALYLAGKLERGEPFTEAENQPQDVAWINDSSRPLLHAIPPRALAELAVSIAEETD